MGPNDNGSAMTVPVVGRKMVTNVGTVSYTAPEILRNAAYDYTVDFWSIGVVMFILLCGYPPFYGDDEIEVMRAICDDEEVVLDDEDWHHVSEEAKALVRSLLSKDPSQRKTCDDILRLTWKVSSKSMSYKKANQKFKQTLIRSKMAMSSRWTTAVHNHHQHYQSNSRQSLSFIEKDSKMSRKLLSRFGSNDSEKDSVDATISGMDSAKSNDKDPVNGIVDVNSLSTAPPSFDDMAPTMNNQQSAMEKDSKLRRAFRGANHSKGTEELMDLMTPSRKRKNTLQLISEE